MSSFVRIVEKVFNIKLDDNSIDDKDKSFQQIVIDYGYEIEEHTVETEDKYTLQIFHLINKNKINSLTAIPVIFIHGLFDSSDGWICNGKKDSLPFILLNQSKVFDVWMMNVRGNKHSKLVEKNSHLHSETFWNFSFHEIGVFDIPQVIKYLMNYIHNDNQCILFAHSIGATAILSGLCELSEFYQKNTKCIVFFNPICVLNHINSLYIIEQLQKSSFDLNSNKKEVFPYIPYEDDDNNKEEKNIFRSVLFNDISSNIDRVNVYLSHYPNGSSFQMCNHLKQIFTSKTFIKYDYEISLNKMIYHSEKPPEYNMNNISKVKILMYVGLEDKLINISDTRWLRDKLQGSGVLYDYQEFLYMAHSSFLVSNSIIWFNHVLRKIYSIVDERNKESSIVKLDAGSQIV